MSVKTLIEEYLRQSRPLAAGPGCEPVGFTDRAEQLRQQERMRRARAFLHASASLTALPTWARSQELQQQRRAQEERLRRAQAFLSMRVGPDSKRAAPDLAALGKAALERRPLDS